jgi:hypothetical protein
MKEFDPSEIEQRGRPDEVKTGYCPLLKANCFGDRCMWWVSDWSEHKNRFQQNCAVALIAVGVNDENLQRLTREEA